ncbi:MAG: geranylgeranylglyceryl/heptaprenylglyceryl phosphate synthase [Prevotellaceae bacterium]|jgi:putative glycerol-1-phosphate prenyltransferase|nr:geranylgeranylglyceryl/heptaprenylglyceryl phosphate synthase [Prevotellaceae bacterium]
MLNTVYQHITENIARGKKMLAVLLDPDAYPDAHLENFIAILKRQEPDFLFVGGSHTTASMEKLVAKLKGNLAAPVILFPGNAAQFTPKADALLNISLLSGRNAEYLISQHVVSSLAIKKSGIEVIPTAYLLIDGGRVSSVEYISNTRPIPRDKNDIAVATALAGELLGMKAVYLEAGSGAINPVEPQMIAAVKSQVSVPLIVGGGIKTPEQLHTAYNAGADVVVIGNVFEKHPESYEQYSS